MRDESSAAGDIDEPGAAGEIMDGVYRALCANGHADLTMQNIADECSKSKSLLHYHYDTKEDLLVAFLDRVIDDFERRVDDRADRPPVDRLLEFVCWFVFEPEETNRESFHIALLELRSEGPFNDRVRSRLERSDDLLRGTVAEILHEGIDAGVVRDVDAEEMATLLVATLDGARTRQITLAGGDRDRPPYTRAVAEAAVAHVVDPLLCEGTARPTLKETIASMPARTGENPRVDDDAEPADDDARAADGVEPAADGVPAATDDRATPVDDGETTGATGE